MVNYYKVKRITFLCFLGISSFFSVGIVAICYVCFKLGVRKGLRMKFSLIDVDKLKTERTVKGSI